MNQEKLSQQNLALLKDERDEVYNSYLTTRKKLIDGNQLDEYQLLYVTTESNHIIEVRPSVVKFQPFYIPTEP